MASDHDPRRGIPTPRSAVPQRHRWAAHEYTEHSAAATAWISHRRWDCPQSVDLAGAGRLTPVVVTCFCSIVPVSVMDAQRRTVVCTNGTTRHVGRIWDGPGGKI